MDKINEGIDILSLKNNEKEAINRSILMMAYNPSCARIFSKDANKKIKNKIFEIVGLLPNIKTQDEFNKVHKDILDNIVNNIRNFRKNNPTGKISYGQAQKGLNVFLKVYVDWANIPTPEIAQVIRQFLHCPLDSVVMTILKEKEEKKYEKYGNLPCDLKHIVTFEQYFKWQKLITEIVTRENRHEKRTIIDVLWYLNSLKIKNEKRENQEDKL